MYSGFNYNNDRFFPLAAPFLLGALTGGVAVAAFNPYRPRPYYPQPVYYYPPYYRPY
ncbi:MAG: hypothetical protein RSB41_02175 [Bacilli bacterium]